MKRLYTETELADRLTLKVQTLQSWRRENVGPPYVKLVGTVRYREDDVDAWVDAQLHRGKEDG